MYTTHYLCLIWHGRINTITMACTMREIHVAHTMGYTIDMKGHTHA
jgi:hypothetical protein